MSDLRSKITWSISYSLICAVSIISRQICALCLPSFLTTHGSSVVVSFPAHLLISSLMSPKLGNLLGSFCLIVLVQSSIFHRLCIFFSMFMLFERIRVVTLPRRLICGYFRFFGQILEQNQAIMGQVIAKLEVRIRRGVVSCIK